MDSLNQAINKMKKFAVIDVGSNSVRLLLWQNGESLIKQAKVTRLAQGIEQSKILVQEAIERTVQAISLFCHIAKEKEFTAIYIFATEAVRSSHNKVEFIEQVKKATGHTVHILTGEEEAECGLMGCLENMLGGIIDIGGASTEIIVADGRQKIYAKSLPIGAVRLYDSCKEDIQKLTTLIESKIAEYGQIPKSNFYAIGGTATSLAALVYQIEPYDSKKVHGKQLTIETVQSWAKKLLQLDLAERKQLIGMDSARADILGGAVLLLASIMQYLNVESITVSENDNLEGYIYKFLCPKKSEV